MRRLSLLLVLLMTGPLRAQPNADEEAKAGFIALFNGKDFSGWRFQNASALGAIPKNWSVADQMIRLSGGGSPHLASQWPFDDFDFRFQWKAMKKGYNSGFYVRSGRNVGANQINLAEKDCGHLMGGPKGGNAVPNLQKLAGEWNDWRALAEGDKLTFWCNGKEAWSVTGFKPSSGYIGFQAEGAAIDFKNIRVRELGYTTLSDLAESQLTKMGWRREGDFLIANKEAQPLIWPLREPPYVIRLEYRGTKGGLALGRDPQKNTVDLADPELAKLANPAEQWNYLQVAAVSGAASVWLNGTDVKSKFPIDAHAGQFFLNPGADLQVRNLRVRSLK